MSKLNPPHPPSLPLHIAPPLPKELDSAPLPSSKYASRYEEYDPFGDGKDTTLSNNDQVQVAGSTTLEQEHERRIALENNRNKVKSTVKPLQKRKPLLNSYFDVDSDRQSQLNSNESKQSPLQIDIKVIVAVAELVADPSRQVEASRMLQTCRDHPQLSFIYESTSLAGVRYQIELAGAKARYNARYQIQMGEFDAQTNSGRNDVQNNIYHHVNPIPTPIQVPVPVPTSLVGSSSTIAVNVDRKRSRESRWGPIITGIKPPSVNTSEILPVNTVLSSAASVSIPVVYSQSNEQQQRLIEQQKQLQLLEAKIREAYMLNSADTNTGSNNSSSSSSSNSLHIERIKEYQILAHRYEVEQSHRDNHRDTTADAYNNGGVIDGGTWEHKKRAVEMLASSEKNKLFTDVVTERGNAFITNYIPTNNIHALLNNSALVNGMGNNSIPSSSQSSTGNPLDSSHIGYKLLSGIGWQDGTALGRNNPDTSSNSSDRSNGDSAQSSGLQCQPSNKPGLGLTSSSSSTHPTTAHTVVADAPNTNDFDNYRLRMQLAYRFRPNPLNNPRRDYY